MRWRAGLGLGVRLGAAAVAVLVASVLAPAGARASVDLGAQQIVVSGPGAKAVINRSPVRVAYAGADGRTVLGEVAPDGANPLSITGSENPPLLGHAQTPGPTRYAPLTFVVGTADAQQFPAGFDAGNELAGVVAGVEYAAQAVVGAADDGAGGARLTLSTDDPSGRRLILDVTPGPGDTITTSVTASPATGVAVMGDSFDSSADEAFHGFGGRHNALDEHGQDFYNWLEEENFGAGPAQPGADASGGNGYLFPNGATAAYHVQPLFISSRPYGFLLDQPELSRFRLDSDRPDAWQVGVESASLAYTVAPGDGPAAVGALNAITGRERVPPQWAAGTQFDRLFRATNGETPAEIEQEVEGDIRDIDSHHTPVSGYRIEGWSHLAPAVLARLIAELHAHGMHTLLYYKAFVVDGDANDLDAPGTYQQAIDGGYVATRAGGQPYLFGSPFIGGGLSAVIDFSNPAAVKWWQGRIRAGLDAGADGFMEDFGEQVMNDMQFADGETGLTMHNHYPVLYHQATRTLIDAYMKEHPGRQIYFFTRAGYTGSLTGPGKVSPGSMASDNGEFPGDETTDYTRSSGLASVATDELNRGLGGAFGTTTDIGGYEDQISGKTTKPLLLRWAELTALTPLFRLHNSANAGTQTPWAFDQETVDDYNALSALHLAAEPLILELWAQADKTGIPLMRPLWLAYPGDSKAAQQDQEWLLGPDVLVAPVVTEDATSRPVYFPAGCWQDPQTGETHTGPSSATVRAPLGKLPYYFHCGTQPFAAAAATISGVKGCGPGGRLRFMIHQNHGRVTRVRVYVGGRRVASVTGRRITRVSILRPAAARYTVRIDDLTATHLRVRTTRRYTGCTAKSRPLITVHRLG